MAEVPWADHVGLFKLLGNLKRICCSTAYLHAFSQEVLRRLEQVLGERAAAAEEEQVAGGGGQGDEQQRRRRESVLAAQRKYRRIREELEKASWEAAAASAGGSAQDQRARGRFVHKLSAWQRDAAAVAAVVGGAMDPGAEERRRQLVETLMGAFCERGLSDRALETLQAFYVDEVRVSVRLVGLVERCHGIISHQWRAHTYSSLHGSASSRSGQRAGAATRCLGARASRTTRTRGRGRRAGTAAG